VLTPRLRDLRVAEKTLVEKAGEAVGFGIAMAEDVAGTVKTAFGAAVTTVTEVLKKAPARKAPAKKTARKTPAKDASKKAMVKKAVKKSPAKKIAKKAAAKTAPAKKAAKKAVKKTAKKSGRRS
jgi:hypothetical protein